MKRKGTLKRNIYMALAGVMALGLTACATPGQKGNAGSVAGSAAGVMTPVDNYLSKEEHIYTDEGTTEVPEGTYASEDGLCKIIKYPSCYDVTLDYEHGSGKAVGAAYAQSISKVYPAYGETVESYVYENIRWVFRGQEIQYEPLDKRLSTLLSSLPSEYREEIESFAETISDGAHGYAEDGRLSYEEAIALELVPDGLRGTACSALSLWGSKTVSGEQIALRSFEYNLGSEGQMVSQHAVVHMVNGEKSITSVTILGVMNMITAVNDDGVFAALVDVGSKEEEPYVYEGKLCYSYVLRHALESFDNARDVGEYMVSKSGDFTWCHIIFTTDKENAFCAEDCVREVAEKGDGFSILRDADTPLHEGLHWDSKDSLCAVNSYASKGNQDRFTNNYSINITRFAKYNAWVAAKDQFTPADVKDMITQEQVNPDKVEGPHGATTVHLVLVDYATGAIQVAFTGPEGVVDKPDFIAVGKY